MKQKVGKVMVEAVERVALTRSIHVVWWVDFLKKILKANKNNCKNKYLTQEKSK